MMMRFRYFVLKELKLMSSWLGCTWYKSQSNVLMFVNKYIACKIALGTKAGLFHKNVVLMSPPDY